MYKFDDLILNKLKKIKNKIDVPVVSIIYNSKNPKEYYIETNNREKLKNITGHAEINCINKVYKKTKNRNLSNYVLISSLLPCEMCYFVARECYLSKIFYYLNNQKKETIFLNNNINNKINLVKIDNINMENEYKKILKYFFSKMR